MVVNRPWQLEIAGWKSRSSEKKLDRVEHQQKEPDFQREKRGQPKYMRQDETKAKANEYYDSDSESPDEGLMSAATLGLGSGCGLSIITTAK